jgi:galactokinase
VSEIARVLETVRLLSEKKFFDVGNNLSASHRSLRDDYNVSCPELDAAVNVALDHGALGARMVGGGFGGSAIALIRQSDAGQISRAIEQVFASQGFTPPRFFTSLPSDGARIEERN